MLTCRSSEHRMHITAWCLSPQEGDQVNLSTEFRGPGAKTNAVSLPDYRCNACAVIRQLAPGTSSSTGSLPFDALQNTGYRCGRKRGQPAQAHTTFSMNGHSKPRSGTLVRVRVSQASMPLLVATSPGTDHIIEDLHDL